MVTVCTTAIAATIPITAMTSTSVAPGTKSIEALDYVFQIMEDYGFSQVDDKAGLFSYSPGHFKSFDKLYKIVYRYGIQFRQQDIQDRMGFLISIRQKLTERFGNDLSAHVSWLDTSHSKLWGKTPREMMSTRGYFDILSVVRVVEGKVA
jgi:hypothetical protein